MKWEQQCRRWWTSDTHTYDSRVLWWYTLRLKLHSFDMLCLCCRLVEYVDNKSAKWSLSLTVLICANNWQLHVCLCSNVLSILTYWRLLPGDSTRHAIWSILHKVRSSGISRYTCCIELEPYMGFGAVMCPIHFLISVFLVNLLPFFSHIYFFTYLPTLRIGLFCFLTWAHNRWPNVAFILLCSFCVVV